MKLIVLLTLCFSFLVVGCNTTADSNANLNMEQMHVLHQYRYRNNYVIEFQMLSQPNVICTVVEYSGARAISCIDSGVK